MARKKVVLPRRATKPKAGSDSESAFRAEFAAASAIEDEPSRARALILLIRRLPEAIAPEMLGAIRTITDFDYQAKAIVALAPRLPKTLIGEALALAANIRYDIYEPSSFKLNIRAPSNARADALAALAPRLPAELVDSAVIAAIEIPEEIARARALIALIPILPNELVFFVFAHVMEFSEAVRTFAATKLVQRIVNPIRGDSLFHRSPGDAPLTEADRTSVLTKIATILPYGSSQRDWDRPIKDKKTGNVDDLYRYMVLYNTSTLHEQFLELFRVYWKVEGDVHQSVDQKDRAWDANLRAAGVPEEKRAALIVQIRILIARATRPTWVGRLERGGELATLTAPQFLKRVHADDIAPDGTVHNEIIRAIDPDLMKMVELYISKRRSRERDLGDAEGLTFVLTRPSSRPGAKKAKSRPHP